MYHICLYISHCHLCKLPFLVNGDDYEDEDFQSSSTSSVTPQKNETKEASVEEEIDVSASDLLASQSSNAENDTLDKSTSNSSLGVADHVEKL